MSKHIAENFYLNAIKDNYTKALTICQYHYATLVEAAAGGDADFVQMRDDFKPVHDALVDALTDKGLHANMRQGKTKLLKTLLGNLPEQFELWVPPIQQVYKKSSPQYKGFFFGGMKSFYLGAIDMRIERLEVLAQALNADAALTATGALVDAYHQQLLQARGGQSGDKGAVKQGIGSAQKKINDMCVAHFVNYGRLIAKFPTQPEKIKAFTDFTTLYAHQHSRIYRGTLHPGELKKAFVHKFTQNSTMSISNKGESALLIYLTKSKNDKVHPAGIMIAAGVSNAVLEIKNLGNASHRVLMIKNVDVVAPGAYEITLNKES